MGRFREDTPGGQKETPLVLPEATLNFSGLFQNIVFWYKQEKKSGVYSFVIVYQEAFFFNIHSDKRYRNT